MPPSCAARDDDRTAADALGAPVGERAGDFLFDREEEAGPGEEGDDPHHRQGANASGPSALAEMARKA